MTVVPAKAYKAFWHRAPRTKLMRSCTVWSALGCVLIFNLMMSNERNERWMKQGIVVKCGLHSNVWSVLLKMICCGKVVSLWIFTILSMKISNTSRSQNARYRVHRATRVLYVRSGIDDQNLTRHQTDACKGTEEGRWIGCYRYYINKYISNKYYTVIYT